MTKPSILVFAYSDVGYECLDFLIENDEYILAVITHEDDPDEETWFRSVSSLAEQNEIPVHTPASVNSPGWIQRIRSWQPDLIFSFYYRRLIDEEILAVPRLGAYNMHGSLLPKYRGRAPINWAVLHGETESGVTLHRMIARADAGDIVDQEKVPIGPDETAHDVMQKCTAAARTVLSRSIEAIESGSPPLWPQDESQATTFGGRTPEDGRIDWTRSAQEIYNLVRAVTQPYPGAFTELNGKRLFVWWAKPLPAAEGEPGRILSFDPLVVATGSGSLEIVNAEWEDEEDLGAAGRLEAGRVLGA